MHNSNNVKFLLIQMLPEFSINSGANFVIQKFDFFLLTHSRIIFAQSLLKSFTFDKVTAQSRTKTNDIF